MNAKHPVSYVKGGRECDIWIDSHYCLGGDGVCDSWRADAVSHLHDLFTLVKEIISIIKINSFHEGMSLEKN